MFNVSARALLSAEGSKEEALMTGVKPKGGDNSSHSHSEMFSNPPLWEESRIATLNNLRARFTFHA